MKAVRVRDARANSTCPACRAPILRGQRIASENGKPFVHIQCFLAGRPGAGARAITTASSSSRFPDTADRSTR